MNEKKQARQRRYINGREKRIIELEYDMLEAGKHIQEVMYSQISLVKQLTQFKQLYAAACKTIEQLQSQKTNDNNSTTTKTKAKRQ